ncbi:hypothetical protein LOAG_08555 [Loa loa]|uniref:Uncharacterized protein n=2 Tax=Loa loa TaxID=7209 RepID=A0A1S0TV10_LOALO|nr:hypothetical protein LOAG_08555 [Loa loa]EFO19937.1 hypothetical protein LOAG_08555 [Loa loa]
MNLKSFFIIVIWAYGEVIMSHIPLAQSTPETDLWINTTYQTEDFGIQYEKLPQCEAWNLWWKLQVGEIAPTAEIIDLLSTLRVKISLSNVIQ